MHRNRYKDFEDGILEHAIGLSIPTNYKFHGNRYGTVYKAWRNFYATNPSPKEQNELNYLLENEFIREIDYTSYLCHCKLFVVTEKGYQYLEKKYGIKINSFRR